MEQANGRFGMTLKMDLDNNVSNLLRRSDQWPFLQRGVPAIWFHTGLHPDYHTSNDRPEKIELREDGAHRAAGAPGELGSRAKRVTNDVDRRSLRSTQEC